MTEIQHTNLSKQAIGALMMALQKSLMEQSDIVPVLKGFNLTKSPDTSRWGTKDGEINGTIRYCPSFRGF